MSFFSEVGEAFLLMRTHRRVHDEVHPVDPRWQRLRWFFVWGLWPLLALNPWPQTTVWLFLLVGFGYVSSLPPLKMNLFEALRMPSRRALYMARMLHSLGWLGWFSVCAGVAVWREAGPSSLNDTERVLVAVMVGLAAPLALAGYGAIVLLFGTRAGWVSTLCLILAVALSSTVGVFFGDTPLELWVAVFAAGTLLGLAMQVWLVGRIEPWKLFLLASQRSDRASPALVTGGRVDVVRPPWLLQGGRRTLTWAMVYRAYALVRYNWMGMVRSFDWLFVLLLPGIFLFTADQPQDVLDSLWWAAVFPAMCLTGAPALQPMHHQRLYLLGVDYRTQILHRLRTFWVSPVMLLAVLVMTIAAVVTQSLLMPLGVLALSLATALFRAGWWEWPSFEVGPGVGWAFLLTLGLIGTACVVASLPEEVGVDRDGRMFVLAGIVTAVALVGVIWRLRKLDEITVWAAFRKP